MAKKQAVRINQGRLIPLWLRLILTCLLFGAMIYVNLNLKEEAAILLSILFSIPVFPIWNTYYLFVIDHASKAYLNGFWTAGFTWGEWKHYQVINEIIILGPENDKPKSPRSGQKAYQAYLSTDEGNKIYLLGNRSKKKLNEILKDIYVKLQLGLKD